MRPVKIDRVGFPCVLSDGSLSTNHTFRLAALSPERLAEAVALNLRDLERILFEMSQGPLRLLRLGSSMVPFASHDAMQFDWRPFLEGPLRQLGERYRPLGFRFSSHPGQYTILNSPDPEVVRKAVRELEYACDLMDMLAPGSYEHVVVIHGGGIYGDRESSTERLIHALRNLPERIRRRLVLENDERLFNLAEIACVGEKAEIPVVFDLHHHQINPCEEPERWLERVRSLWGERPPKVHLSSQRPGARQGAHDDMLDPVDLQSLVEILPWSADLMVEAKAKELAAWAAWQWLQSHSTETDATR